MPRVLGQLEGFELLKVVQRPLWEELKLVAVDLPGNKTLLRIFALKVVTPTYYDVDVNFLCVHSQLLKTRYGGERVLGDQPEQVVVEQQRGEVGRARERTAVQ